MPDKDMPQARGIAAAANIYTPQQTDINNARKAAYYARLLVEGLQRLHSTDNALLCQVAEKLLATAADLVISIERTQESLEKTPAGQQG